MRFKVRSLGGKLILVAALTLLLCLVLFSALSWELLLFTFEHEARSDASSHLSTIRDAYADYTNILLQDIKQVAQDPNIISALSQPSTPVTRQILQSTLDIDPLQRSHLLCRPRLFLLKIINLLDN